MDRGFVILLVALGMGPALFAHGGDEPRCAKPKPHIEAVEKHGKQQPDTAEKRPQPCPVKAPILF